MTELLYYEDAYLKECDATLTQVDEEGIVLDRTVFYPTGGGQPGDSGLLEFDDGSVVTIETTRRRRSDGALLHIPAAHHGDTNGIRPGVRALARLDWQRRYAHMRIHTCLHLLSAVIRAGVTGGSIGVDSGRLDFDLPGAKPDREVVEAGLNQLIEQAHPVSPRWITGAELESRPELVKTMSVAPPQGVARVRLLEIAGGVDLQACGGTHVANTSEVGTVAVTRIESKGARNRRVVVGFAGGKH